MKIIICGYTGMLGQALIQHLKTQHELYGVSRKKPNDLSGIKTLQWQGLSDLLNEAPIDVIINLCGESIAQPWISAVQKRIRSSRITPTMHLVHLLKAHPEIHLLNASGIGIYPTYTHMPDDFIAAAKPAEPPLNFMQQLALDWENATTPHQKTTLLRTAPVMSTHQGILKQLTLTKYVGQLCQIGPGQQPFPWIGLIDWCRSVEWIINKKMLGAVDLTSPHVDRFTDLMDSLAVTLDCRKWIIPEIFVKPLLGSMIDALMLQGPIVTPHRLLDDGFSFAVEKIKDLYDTH